MCTRTNNITAEICVTNSSNLVRTLIYYKAPHPFTHLGTDILFTVNFIFFEFLKTVRFPYVNSVIEKVSVISALKVSTVATHNIRPLLKDYFLKGRDEKRKKESFLLYTLAAHTLAFFPGIDSLAAARNNI